MSVNDISGIDGHQFTPSARWFEQQQWIAVADVPRKITCVVIRTRLETLKRQPYPVVAMHQYGRRYRIFRERFNLSSSLTNWLSAQRAWLYMCTYSRLSSFPANLQLESVTNGG